MTEDESALPAQLYEEGVRRRSTADRNNKREIDNFDSVRAGNMSIAFQHVGQFATNVKNEIDGVVEPIQQLRDLARGAATNASASAQAIFQPLYAELGELQTMLTNTNNTRYLVDEIRTLRGSDYAYSKRIGAKVMEVSKLAEMAIASLSVAPGIKFEVSPEVTVTGQELSEQIERFKGTTLGRIQSLAHSMGEIEGNLNKLSQHSADGLIGAQPHVSFALLSNMQRIAQSAGGLAIGGTNAPRLTVAKPTPQD